MRIFVTGASGWIGSAVVPELIGAGHQWSGLPPDAFCRRFTSAGAEVQRGTLDDLDVLRKAAGDSDGVMHPPRHRVMLGDFQGAADADRRAVEAIGDALAGSDRPFVIASGIRLAPGHLATERDGHALDPTAAAFGPGPQTRHATAELVLSLASSGVRSSIVRLAPTVHGDGDNGFVATLVDIARDKGVSGYIGDGANRWPAVHRFDAARLFRLAIENAPAGSTLHAIADEGVQCWCATSPGGHRQTPDVPEWRFMPGHAAGHHLAGPSSPSDSPASNALTRELLGWQPTHPGLLADLDQGHYWNSAWVKLTISAVLRVLA